MDGLNELVNAVDSRIKRDKLHAEVKDNLLMWHDTHQKSRIYADKVKNGESLTEEESAIFQDIVSSAMVYQSEQIERLIASGVIKDDKEFGLECQKVSNLVYDRLSQGDTD